MQLGKPLRDFVGVVGDSLSTTLARYHLLWDSDATERSKYPQYTFVIDYLVFVVGAMCASVCLTLCITSSCDDHAAACAYDDVQASALLRRNKRVALSSFSTVSFGCWTAVMALLH
jgi:hypothetical protein